MSYRGRPSKGCESCRARKVKCDETKPICNRCHKSNHDCKYRDQSDLLFRNQTAFAAQKAEESWRKRSKSHQRAESDGSSYHSSPSTHQSPPSNHSSPRSDLASDPSASLADFNNLSVSHSLPPDLHRLAYERFLYDWIVLETPNKNSDEPSDAIWDFLPLLYQRSAEGSCLAAVISAISYANFSSRCNAPQALGLAEEHIGKGIKLLQKAIADPKQAGTDETLAAVYLMGVYENITSSVYNGSFLAHKEGANALLQLRTVGEFYSNPISARLYEVSYAQMLIGNLQSAKAPPLPIRDFNTAKEYIPTMYSTSGIYVIRLIHSVTHLHAEWQDFKQVSSPPTTRSAFRRLLQRGLELDAEYQAWENTIPRVWRYQIEMNSPEVRGTYDPKWVNLVLGARGAPKEIHCYTSLKRAWIWSFYRTSRMFLLRDIIEIINWMLRLPEPEPETHTDGAADIDPHIMTNQWPLDNITLQINHAFATTHLVTVIEQSCSAVLSHFTVPVWGKSLDDVMGLRGYTPFWSLGVMDAILKLGMVPDSGSLVNRASTTTATTTSRDVQQPSISTLPDTHFPPHIPHSDSTPNTFFNSATITPDDADVLNPAPALSCVTPLALPPALPPNAHPFLPNDSLHIFDSSPPHPFDFSSSLPPLDFTIRQPSSIDVAARRDWIHNILQFLATELGIKKGLAVLRHAQGFPGNEWMVNGQARARAYGDMV
ncbi:uncharacterized protein BDR25DRAFT_324876 [Lindgomyces ingoldianus]|uniref:Uncharacterized protein n=1 Tax=Lindgomyces ingoldianus TaxID=673940 RepID=A0ACB6QXS9_9PLEO|nr:uncharacterized protein BDR25DRAFT_324876 [Lindgomyces ingoldianus]KAF2471721.1 hypothetical protein BDR25DRAFT_324876 [Lindgomyces ingoldianus]